MSKKTASPTVMAHHVKRNPRLLSQDDLDRAAVARHQAAQRAAHRTIDIIDATLAMKESKPPRIVNEMTYNDPPVGVGSRAMPPTMDEIVNEIRMKPQAPAEFPVPVIHVVARNATNYLALMGALTAFVAGVALGKALT